MPLVKVKPTSAGRRALVKVVDAEPAQGRAGRRADRVAEARLGPQQQRPHHDAPQGRRPQAALPHHRLQAQQGRHPGQGRAPRVRPEPQRAHRAAAATRTASAATSSRRSGVAVGAQLMSGQEAPIKAGNTLPLRNIPVGTTIHCVEMQPGKGAQIARSAGAGVQLLAREGIYAQLRLRSGEIRKVHVDCRATIGEVGNEEHNLRSIGKAGAHALARHPPDGARRRDEPGRPPAWAAANGRTGTKRIRCRRGARRPRATRRARTSARTR